MNRIKVSEKIFLNHNSEIVWKIISSKNALELFHPYCLKNDAIDYKKKDKLVYLNGLTYFREFSAWKPNNGFELIIGISESIMQHIHLFQLRCDNLYHFHNPCRNQVHLQHLEELLDVAKAVSI